MDWYLDGIQIQAANINDGDDGADDEQEELLIFVETIDGQIKICYRGFYFNRHKDVISEPGTVRYQCEECNRAGVKCRGYIWERNGRLRRVGNDHTHESNAARVHHLQVSRIS